MSKSSAFRFQRSTENAFKREETSVMELIQLVKAMDRVDRYEEASNISHSFRE